VKRRLEDRDLWAGVVFVVFGAAALALGTDLQVGSAAEMGEGYVPRAMAFALVALGAAIAVPAWRRSAARAETALERMRWRPLFFVTAAILAFVAALEPLGLVAAIALSVATANFAGQPLKLRSLALLVAILSFAVTALFIWALGLPLHALPRLS
jgi:putative tricarboxylic transport membrane protein